MAASAATIDHIRSLIGVIEAGKINSDQAQLILELRAALGDALIACDHTMDSTCDPSNIFHCNGCGIVVPAPEGTFA